MVAATAADALVGDTVNIARGAEVSVTRICDLLLELLDARDLEPEHAETRPGDVERHPLVARAVLPCDDQRVRAPRREVPHRPFATRHVDTGCAEIRLDEVDRSALTSKISLTPTPEAAAALAPPVTPNGLRQLSPGEGPGDEPE